MTLKKLFKILGPGFITGASDDDPAGIATYAQTGAQFGFTQSWSALFSFPLMASVQEMCGRIGLVTGIGLAGVIKKHYAKKLLYPIVFLLVMANTINIGADLGAMAESVRLLIDVPFWFVLIIIVCISLALQIFIPYKMYANYLKYFALTLFAYILAAFIIKIDWGKVILATFVPSFSFSKDYLLNVVAILGTTISPYLFFWQASEEVEEEIAHHRLQTMGIGKPKVTTGDIQNLRVDTIAGMFFSNLIMFFIIVTTGATLHSGGIHEINSASDAALALKPLAGDLAFLLFAFGIVGTGFLAVPVLAGAASYAVSESMGWKEGLYRNFTKARGFYIIIILATICGMLTNALGINPMHFLYYSAVVNGLIAPILLFIILIIANNKDIMGKRTNNSVSNVFGFGTALFMGIAALALLATLFVQ